MRIVVSGVQRRVGAWVADHIIDLNLADSRLPPDLASFIGLGPGGLDGAREVIERVNSGALQSSGDGQGVVQPRAAVKLLAPWTSGARIACAGANYARHLAGTRAANTGEHLDLDEVYRQSRSAGPWGFWKVIADVRGDGDDVIYPARASRFDYEGEAAIVIGTSALDVPADRVGEHIWGITLLNDWSIRNDMGPGRPMSFNLPKNFDSSTSIGPCIVVGEELDPQNLTIQTRVNGTLRQDYSTSEMTFSFGELLEFLSRDFTFLPGDIIAGGTGAGTAMDSSRPGPDAAAPSDLFLKPGDEVEVSSPSIGALRNRVVRKSP